MNLYQASQIYFVKSQRAMMFSLIVSLLLLCVSLVSLRSLSDKQDAILILVVIVLQVIQMYFKYQTLSWAGKADIPRRMHQLQNGLNMHPSMESCARIEEEVGICDALDVLDYWLSEKMPGPERMIEMILESSFYTRAIAAKCRNYFIVFSAAGLMIVAGFIIYEFRTNISIGQNGLAVRFVLMILVFFLSGDFWGIGLLYNDLSKAADASHKKACSILEVKQGNNYELALEIALDYNTAVVQGPPLLSWTYKNGKDEMSKNFKRNYGKLLGISN